MKLGNPKYRVSHNIWHRRDFNPKNIDDLNEYKYFLQHQKWRSTCPFVLEWPFVDMLQMIEHKIVRHHINTIVKSVK
jgi:hypothetical protein